MNWIQIRLKYSIASNEAYYEIFESSKVYDLRQSCNIYLINNRRVFICTSGMKNQNFRNACINVENRITDRKFKNLDELKNKFIKELRCEEFYILDEKVKILK